MSLVIIGVLIMFCINNIIKFILTYSLEYLFTLLFTASQITLFYLSGFYKGPYYSIFIIIAHCVFVISFNLFFSLKCKAKRITLINNIINILILLSAILSIFIITVFHRNLKFFHPTIYLLSSLFLLNVITYLTAKWKIIRKYEIFLCISSVVMILFLSMFLYNLNSFSNFNYFLYLPFILFIVYFELNALVEKQLINVELGNAVMNKTFNKNHDFTKYNFTEREIEISILLFEKYTAKEIAFNLSVSKSTVDWHIFNMYKKSGVNNRKDFLKLFNL